MRLHSLFGATEVPHRDFEALQREAMREGVPLPPSTLRAMLREEFSTENPASQDVSPSMESADRQVHRVRLPQPPPESSSLRLMQLPDCALLHILSLLDARTLWTLPCVSRGVQTLATNDSLWRALVKSRFEPISWALPPGALEPRPDSCYRDLYYSLSAPGEGSWQRLAVSTHSSEDSCWLVIQDVVYDVTTFIRRHPGMATSLLLFGGTDATEAFLEVPHSQLALRLMRTFEVPGLELPMEGHPVYLPPPQPKDPQPSWRIDHRMDFWTANPRLACFLACLWARVNRETPAEEVKIWPLTSYLCGSCV
ncbi:hypothetical protein AB1Y20_015328 [Prymnesium parvum]|uniref:Cytochrome b5 heme-binding domain-containing protein n=1 Tax=Prymnesium parvum TaxID=97485 RepID=A0AB34JY31_PRYPA